MPENNILLVTADGRAVCTHPADCWPFPSVNGQQIDQSKALQADKSQHKPTPVNLDDVEEALL